MNKLIIQIKVPLILAAILVLSSCSRSGGYIPTTQPYSSANEYIKSENFIGSILVKKNDSYILNKGFGLSNKKQHDKNINDTKYRIGSLTKAFTALAIVQLKKKNLIHSYDDYIGNYLTDYPNGNKITIRDLLTHRTGIPDYPSKANLSHIYTPSQLIDLFKNLNLEFSPGDKFKYSNSNYALLGYIVEQVSGVSYKRYMQDNVWSVLGMHNTEYGESTITGENNARGYKSVSQEHSVNYINMSIPYSAGALVSTISDMEKWTESFKHKTLVSEEDNQQIFREGGYGYGFGWGVIQIVGKKAYAHSGSIDGFTSMIAIFPENNSFIIILSNVQGEGQKLSRIVATIAKKEFN